MERCDILAPAAAVFFRISNVNPVAVNGIRNPFGYQPWRENRTFQVRVAPPAASCSKRCALRTRLTAAGHV